MVIIEEILQTLNGINWDFSNYNSSRYPLDINSIPWYPATFIPPIPKFLIALLTKSGDTVLDPFGGKGTTAIETVKQGRFPIYNDINPFASEITRASICAIRYCVEENEYLSCEETRVIKSIIPTNSLDAFAHTHNISKDVFKWYDADTLSEIFAIKELMETEYSENPTIYNIRKLALCSILKQASSQPGHFTYVTDNCTPDNLTYRNAVKLYIDKIQQILLAGQDLVIQSSLTQSRTKLVDILNNARIVTGDARNLSWIDDKSINLVLTSPPYLCAQDYIKTMRLTHLLFPNKNGFEENVKLEIGPRSKRGSKSEKVVTDYYSDLNSVFSEVQRVLVPGGFFCLIIGQGKSRVTKSYSIVSDLYHSITTIHGFHEMFHVQREIGSRVIQIGGVDKEHIYIFQKN